MPSLHAPAARRLLLHILLLATPAWAWAMPPGCTAQGALMTCPLGLGATGYTIDGGAVKALALVNPPGGPALQLNQVLGQSLSRVANTFGEYCVYLDDFETRQTRPGVGEVGCYPKPAGERRFGALEWGTSTALAVPPGTTLYFQGYVQTTPGHGMDYPFQFNVTTYPQSRGIFAYRQPKIDAAIPCTGAPQPTAGSPWTNDAGRPLTVLGAFIYALEPPPTAACLYVLAAGSSKPRWKQCNLTPGNRRGVAMLPAPVTVQPGEAILAQASYTCAAGQVWDWAAYVYTY